MLRIAASAGEKTSISRGDDAQPMRFGRRRFALSRVQRSYDEPVAELPAIAPAAEPAARPLPPAQAYAAALYLLARSREHRAMRAKYGKHIGRCR